MYILFSSLRGIMLDKLKLLRFNDSFMVDCDVLLNSLEPDFWLADVLYKLNNTIININEP